MNESQCSICWVQAIELDAAFQVYLDLLELSLKIITHSHPRYADSRPVVKDLSQIYMGNSQGHMFTETQVKQYY